nr:hypothetical protein [Geodermatophilus obscurus]
MSVSTMPGQMALNGVDPDAGVDVLHGRGLGHADHAPLGGGIPRLSGDSDDPGAGGGVDDGAAGGLHQRDLVLHAQEHPGEVHVDDPVPLLGGQLGERGAGLLDAGVVERQVQPPEGLDRPVQRGSDVVLAGDVAGQRQRAAAVGLDQPGGLADAVLGDAGDGDGGALRGEGQGGRPADADAAAGAGDEGDLPGEAGALRGRHRRVAVSMTNR